jgi:FMN phosphatase YigB (HAD superfamily)
VIYPKSETIYVFDFDGVICDSTDECMVTAWNSWQEWNGVSQFRENLDAFSEEEKMSFALQRPRVRGAGEYYILKDLESIEKNIENQSEYDLMVIKNNNKIESFKKIFYKNRERLRSKNVASWINLHPIYWDVIDFFKNIISPENLFIATLKDGESVKIILESCGVFLLPERILDESVITNKLDALNIIADKSITKKSHIIFIDDNVTHLLEPHKQGFSVFLSGWSNLLSEHREVARKENIAILNNVNDLINKRVARKEYV